MAELNDRLIRTSATGSRILGALPAVGANGLANGLNHVAQVAGRAAALTWTDSGTMAGDGRGWPFTHNDRQTKAGHSATGMGMPNANDDTNLRIEGGRSPDWRRTRWSQPHWHACVRHVVLGASSLTRSETKVSFSLCGQAWGKAGAGGGSNWIDVRADGAQINGDDGSSGGSGQRGRANMLISIPKIVYLVGFVTITMLVPVMVENHLGLLEREALDWVGLVFISMFVAYMWLIIKSRVAARFSILIGPSLIMIVTQTMVRTFVSDRLVPVWHDIYTLVVCISMIVLALVLMFIVEVLNFSPSAPRES